MAVPKRKTSKSRRDKRRSHHALKLKNHISTESESGDLHLSHHMTKEGIYKGKQIIIPKTQKDVGTSSIEAEQHQS